MKSKYISLKPLLALPQAQRPVDWARQFGRSGLLEVEIGSGLGEFLIRSARDCPDKNFIGIEYDQKRVQKILRGVAQAKLENIRVLFQDARIVFERLIPPSTVRQVYCLFPCPWPKRRHIKHRLFSGDFLKLVNSRLIASGEFMMVTDFRPYVDWVLEQVGSTGFKVETKMIAPRYGTKFERKWMETGQNEFFELRLIKEKHIAVPLKEDLPVRSHKLSHFDPRNFSMSSQTGEINVVFKEFLYDPEVKKAIVRLIVSEENFAQDLWIEIVHKSRGWFVEPAQGCPFISTEGVALALELVFAAAELSSKKG